MAQPTQLVKQDTAKSVSALLERNKGALSKALPKHVNADRLMRVAISAISQNPALLECTPESLFRCIVASGMLGLEPNTPTGHAYLVPFADGKTGKKNVQLIPGYRGLIDLAHRAGGVQTLAAHMVYTKDEFIYELGLEPKLVHKPCMDTDRGEMLCVYAIYKGKEGQVDFEVMPIGEVQRIRECAKSKNSPAWVNFFDEMARKTAIRRLVKRIPISLELARASSLDDKAAIGESQEVELADAIIDVENIAMPSTQKEESAPASESEDGAPWFAPILAQGATEDQILEWAVANNGIKRGQTLANITPDWREAMIKNAASIVAFQ
jgi:recombination protein RecT